MYYKIIDPIAATKKVLSMSKVVTADIDINERNLYVY